MSEHHDQREEEATQLPCSRKGLRSLGFAAAAAALLVAAWGIFSRDEHARAVATWTQAAAIPTVAIVHPKQDTADPELVLPGDVQAWYSAPVYARVNGYLKMWYFDYGARVKKDKSLPRSRHRKSTLSSPLPRPD
jgi:multidrug efflux pump subunit AcrA (membrane-fusion protein)